MELSETAKVGSITQLWTETRSYFSEFRREQQQGFKYARGDQIDRATRERLRRNRRPAAAVNLVRPLIIYLGGVIAENKDEMIAYAKEEGDETKADMHTKLVKDWAMDNCDADYEFAHAAIDAAVGKVGFVNNYYTYRYGHQGKWITERVDPRMVQWDPEGKKRDTTDWRNIEFSGFYTLEEILGTYANMPADRASHVEAEALKLEREFASEGKPRTFLDRARSVFGIGMQAIRARQAGHDLSPQFADLANGVYRVIEHHDVRHIKARWVYSPYSREMERLPDSIFVRDYDPAKRQAYIEAVKEKMVGADVREIPAQQLWVTSICPTLAPDAPLLEQQYAVSEHGFALKPIFCDDLDPDLTETKSIVDNLVDPQDQFNQLGMTLLEMMMDMAYPNTIAPVGSIPPEFVKDWTEPARHIIKWFRPGAQKPEREMPNPAVLNFDRLRAEARDLLEKTSGLNANLQGFMQSASESGILYARRVEQGMMMLNYLFQQIRRCRRATFNYCDANLQLFLSLQRMVRLLNKENKLEWLRLNWPTIEGIKNKVDEGEFDFKADVSQTGATTRRIKFAEMLELIRMAPPQYVPWSSAFKLWDSPVSPDFVAWAQKVEAKMGMAEEETSALASAGAAAGVLKTLAAAGQGG